MPRRHIGTLEVSITDDEHGVCGNVVQSACESVCGEAASGAWETRTCQSLIG